MDNAFYQLMAEHPKLHLQLAHGRPTKVLGEVEVRSAGCLYGIFHCEIILGNDFPNSFPKVFELSGLIPREGDRHVNPDGSLCLTVTPIEIIRAINGVEINEFFSEFLIPYLAAQIWFDRTGRWAGGEYKHGSAGIVQYFKEEMGIKDDFKLREVLACYLDSQGRIEGKRCICNSGKLFMRCCAKQYLVMKALPLEYLEKVIGYIPKRAFA
jgi:hypothetical protein